MKITAYLSFFWWASEICARLWPDKDQSFAILFADLFLIEPSKKARLHGDDVFFPGILSMSLSYQSFCVVDGGWNDVDDPHKMVCELWISATFRCRSSVQRACPTAGMLQVYHESWQKHLIKPPKHPVMDSVTSPKTNISPELVLFTWHVNFFGGARLGLSGHKWIRFG